MGLSVCIAAGIWAYLQMVLVRVGIRLSPLWVAPFPKYRENVLFQLSTDTTQKGLTEEISISDQLVGMSMGVF